MKKSQNIEKNVNLSISFDKNPLIEKFEKENTIKKKEEILLSA